MKDEDSTQRSRNKEKVPNGNLRTEKYNIWNWKNTLNKLTNRMEMRKQSPIKIIKSEEDKNFFKWTEPQRLMRPYETISTCLAFMSLESQKVKEKEFDTEKNIWRNNKWKLLKFIKSYKFTNLGSSVNLK